NGMEELVVSEISRLGTGALPAPREVLVADLETERYSGQLVRVYGELLVPAELPNKKRDLMIRDRSGQIPVSISDRFFANQAFVSRLMQGGEVELVGLASQSDTDPPFNSDYRIVPRDPDDFKFAPIPPYRLIGFGLALASLGAVAVCLWLRRHRAE